MTLPTPRLAFLACVCSLGLALLVLPVQAGITIQFSPPLLSGDGCPSGSADYHIARSGRTLTLVFDQYHASSTALNCSITVNVQVPEGLRVSSLTAAYQGKVEGQANLNRSYFVAGTAGPAIRESFNTHQAQSYQQSDTLISMGDDITGCGENLQVRISSQLSVRNASSSIQLDAQDLSHGLQLHVLDKPCH